MHDVADESRPSERRRLYGVRAAAENLSLSRAEVYRLMDCGRLPSVKHGRRRLIKAKALDDFAESLPPAEPAETG